MNRIQRISGVLVGVGFILMSIILVFESETGFQIVCGILFIMLFITGVRSLLYYFTMARYMVGGRRSLYKGVILFDLGMFTLTLNDIPIQYVILYLVAIHAFAGAVDVLNALEAHRLETPAWKSKMLFGAGNIVMAVLCVIFGFIRASVDSVVYIYAAGLFYSGIVRIAESFRKTAVVYIQ